MAAINVTAGEVVQSTDPSRLSRGVGGEDLAIGDFVYRKSSDGRMYKADADALESSQASHVVVSENAAAGQPVELQDLDGPLTVGATAALAVGEPYFVHTTAGKIGPRGDLAAGDFATFVGIATSTSVLACRVKAGAVALAA